MWIIGIILVAVGVLLAVFRNKQKDRLLDIKFVKTSTAAELTELQQAVAVEIGAGGFRRQAEVKGVCRTEMPLKAELSGQECVYYSMSVAERYEETVTERDAQGRSVTRTQTGSATVASNTRSAPFLLEDDTGRIAVDPSGAKIDGIPAVNRYEPYSPGMTALKHGSFSLSLQLPGFGGRRVLGYQYNESIIPTGAKLFVIGEASDAGGSLSIRKPEEKNKPFIVTVKSEEDLIRGKESGVKALFYGAIACFVIGAALIIAGVLT